MTKVSLALLLALSLTVLVPAAHAYDARFSIDTTQDLASLEHSGQVNVQASRNDKKFTLDASAVVHVDINRLYAISIDYDHYIEYGVPDLKEIHVVSQGPGDILDTWQDMAASGQESKHYFEVHTSPVLDKTDAKGVEWTLIPARAGWTYPDKPMFSTFDGSWYMEPQADGSLYVRYYMTATINTNLPGIFLDLFVKNIMAGQVRKVVEALVAAASR